MHSHCTFKTVTDCKSLKLPADIMIHVPVQSKIIWNGRYMKKSKAFLVFSRTGRKREGRKKV